MAVLPPHMPLPPSAARTSSAPVSPKELHEPLNLQREASSPKSSALRLASNVLIDRVRSDRPTRQLPRARTKDLEALFDTTHAQLRGLYCEMAERNAQSAPTLLDSLQELVAFFGLGVNSKRQ